MLLRFYSPPTQRPTGSKSPLPLTPAIVTIKIWLVGNGDSRSLVFSLNQSLGVEKEHTKRRKVH